MDKRDRKTKPTKRSRVKRTADEKCAIGCLICFALLLSVFLVCFQLMVAEQRKTAQAEELSRHEQVEAVRAELADQDAERESREASNKAYRIEQVKKQAEEELTKRQAEAEAQEEAIEVNAGNMWKNQQIDFITGNGALSKTQGVNNYNGRRETWYSSRVAKHYLTGEWTADENGVYRDIDGYVVVASSDHAFGAVLDTSHGAGKVYDTGCASGTTDIYVNW